MPCAYSIPVIALLACVCSESSAQKAIDLSGDHEQWLPSILLDQHPIEMFRTESTLTPIDAEQLSALRASGVDPTWIAQRFDIPDFNPALRRITQDDDPQFIESWATHHSDNRGMRIGDSIQFKVGRTTDLNDGNISGSKNALGGENETHIASLTQSEGEYDIYDLSLEWDAVDAGPLKLSVLSGLKAIEANIAKRVVDASGDSRIDSEHRVTAMPMVGSGVRWQINEDLSFSGSAITHPIENGDALIDFNASTDLRISRNVGFVAGYRIIRSSFDVGDVSTELTQEGLFARLQIRF